MNVLLCAIENSRFQNNECWALKYFNFVPRPKSNFTIACDEELWCPKTSSSTIASRASAIAVELVESDAACALIERTKKVPKII